MDDDTWIRLLLRRCVPSGLALCDCDILKKRLELQVDDAVLEHALRACGHTVPAPREAPEPPSESLKRARGDHADGSRAPGSAMARCSECGRHGGRGGLVRCMGCDASFHRKCADLHGRAAAEVCLCPDCWDAQR